MDTNPNDQVVPGVTPTADPNAPIIPVTPVADEPVVPIDPNAPVVPPIPAVDEPVGEERPEAPVAPVV